MIIDEDKPLSPAPFRDPVSVPDYSMPRSNSYVERRQVEGTTDNGVSPFSLLTYRVGEPLPPEEEGGDPTDQFVVTLKEGYVVEHAVSGNAVILHIPAISLVPMDTSPRPSITVPVGKAIYVRVQTNDSGAINTSVSIVVDVPDKASVHYVAGTTNGDYYYKVGAVEVIDEEVVYKSYIQSDIDQYAEIDDGGGGGEEELYPWKIRLVGDDYEVYGTGATVEKRWSGDMYTVNGLDTPLTLGESTNYVYLRGSVAYGEIDELDVTVESVALDRIVTVDGEQTELNVLIGIVFGASVTQKLRDPLVLTLTCVAGVPAWVPILSEGVA